MKYFTFNLILGYSWSNILAGALFTAMIKNTNPLIFLLFFTVLPANAEQLNFERVNTGFSHEFNISWQDHRKRQHSINFAIDNKVLFNKFREFKAYKPEVAEQKIIQNIKRQLRDKPLEGVSVLYQQQGTKTNIRLSGRNQEALAAAEEELAIRKQLALDMYFEREYYHKFTSPTRQQAIKPDHLRFARESIDDLDPLVEALFVSIPSSNNRSDLRGIFNYVLSFIQAIPYEALQSRLTSSGAGFNPPNKLIYENKGDCDSKVTLAITLLKPLFPNVEFAIILVPGHALLGIGAPYNNSEDIAEVNGNYYVLAEPTGPALMPLGQIADQSRGFIRSGQYSGEVFK